METGEQKSLGIYLHIPFCMRKCFYCDFLSAPGGGQERANYVKALCREISGESKRYKGYTVNTIFIGGGTPSLLEGESIGRILDKVYENYKVSNSCEISMEVNPGTATREKLMHFKAGGGNRLSIGLQSASDGELKALGRIHTYEDFLATYEMALKEGFFNINVDLMTGVPGQNKESLMDTLQKITQLPQMPTHISAYALIIEEGTPFYEKTPVLPEEDLERELYKITNDFLVKKGYLQYEISNYALPGYMCKHNTVYWRRGNYVGFGIGAASMIENVRFHNTRDREKYVDYFINNKRNYNEERNAGRNASDDSGTENKNTCDFKKNLQDSFRNDWIKEDIQALSVKEQMEEFMFLGLRMNRGVCKDVFLRTFGKTIDEIYPGIVEELCQKGLLTLKKEPPKGEEWIALTPFGMDVSNRVMAEFLFP